MSAGWGRPAAASAIRCFARSSAKASTGARLLSAPDGHCAPRLRASAELVAQVPIEPRDASRLLVYRRDRRRSSIGRSRELPELLDGELVVVNDTRVVPARLRLRRASGGAVEVLLVENLDDGTWEALARPSGRLRAGEQLGAGAAASSRAARDAGSSSSTASRQARRRCRRTSTSRSRSRVAIRPSTRT